MDEKLMTLKEVAEHLSCSTRHLLNEFKAGRLHVMVISPRVFRISKEALEAFKRQDKIDANVAPPYININGRLLRSEIRNVPASTKIVWLVCQLMADKNRNLIATPRQISKKANVPLDLTEAALTLLQDPKFAGVGLTKISKNFWHIDGVVVDLERDQRLLDGLEEELPEESYDDDGVDSEE